MFKLGAVHCIALVSPASIVEPSCAKPGTSDVTTSKGCLSNRYVVMDEAAICLLLNNLPVSYNTPCCFEQAGESEMLLGEERKKPCTWRILVEPKCSKQRSRRMLFFFKKKRKKYHSRLKLWGLRPGQANSWTTRVMSSSAVRYARVSYSK